MRKLLTLLTFILITSTAFSQALTYNWSQRHGSPNADRITVIEATNDDFVYAGGNFKGTMLISDDGIEGLGTSIGEEDGFVTKTDVDGNHIWSRYFHSEGKVVVNAIYPDLNSDVYVVGHFTNKMYVEDDQQKIDLEAADKTTGFIVKFDYDGGLIWAKMIDSRGMSNIYSVTGDSGNNFYLGGTFKNSTNFGLNGENQRQTSVPFRAASSTRDAFLAKYDQDGNFIWVHTYGDQSDDEVKDIAVDEDDNVVITGNYLRRPDFNPSEHARNTIPYSGAAGIFVAKYRADGKYIFAFGLPRSSGGGHKSNTLAIDRDNNIYIAGALDEQLDLDPSDGVRKVMGYSGNYAFYAKYDGNGRFIWGNSFGNTSTQAVYDIALDASANLYLTGTYYANMSITDHKGYSRTMVPKGRFDAFVARYDSSGAMQWHTGFGSSAYEYGFGISVNDAGNVFVGGSFSNRIDFNPGDGESILESNGDLDAFKIRFDGGCVADLLETSINAIMVEQGESFTVTSSGMDIISYSDGIQNGVPFVPSESNTYYAFGRNNDGCTDKNAINVTVDRPEMIDIGDGHADDQDGDMDETDQISEGPQRPPVGDGHADDQDTDQDEMDQIVDPITIEETPIQSVENISICAGESLVMPDGADLVNIVQSMNYVSQTRNDAGRRVTTTVNITVIELNTEVVLAGIKLSATQTGATYQWLDADRNFAPISGATDQTYMPKKDGNYALEITIGECTKRSETINVMGASYFDCDPFFDDDCELPEPCDSFDDDCSAFEDQIEIDRKTIGLLTVKFGEIRRQMQVTIMTLEGKVLFTQSFSATNFENINMNDMADGNYLVEVSDEQGNMVRQQVVKN